MIRTNDRTDETPAIPTAPQLVPPDRGPDSASATYYPGPLDQHRTFIVWTSDADGTTNTSVDCLLFGVVSVDDAIGQCVRDLDPGESGFISTITEGPRVVARVRLQPGQEPTIERFEV